MRKYKQQHPRKALYFAWSFTLLFFFSARFSARFLCFDVILYYPILCEHIYFFFKFNPRIQFIRFLWLDHQNHVQPTEISSSTAHSAPNNISLCICIQQQAVLHWLPIPKIVTLKYSKWLSTQGILPRKLNLFTIVIIRAWTQSYAYNLRHIRSPSLSLCHILAAGLVFVLSFALRRSISLCFCCCSCSFVFS